MTGHSDAFAPSGITSAISIASDLKDGLSDFIAGISVANTVALALISALAVFLCAELAWRERRRRGRRGQEAPASDENLRRGETSP